MHIKCDYVTIVQEPNFSQCLDEYSEVYSRMIDVHAGIDWTFGRNPLEGSGCIFDI